MGVVIGILIRLITFPGVLLNTWVCRLTCKMLGIKVIQVDYSKLLFGMAIKVEPPEVYLRLFAFIFWPFIIMTVIALPFCYLAIYSFKGIGYLLFLYASVAIAANAFPHLEMANMLWKQSSIELKQKNYIAVLGFPLVIIVYALSLLKHFWIDILYGLFLLVLMDDIFFKHQ